MKEITIPYNFTPRDYQLEVFKAMDSGIRFAVLVWNRRAGKDKTCFNYLVKKALEKVGLYYYFFPSYSQGRKALWEAIQDGEKLLDHIPKELLAKKPNSNEMKIDLINGSIIRVVGTDNFDSIRGTNPIGAVFSEYSEQNPDALSTMMPVFLENDGWFIVNGTPKGKNHLYDLFTKASLRPDWFTSKIQTMWADLPNYYHTVSQEDIDMERAIGRTEAFILQEYGCCFDSAPEGTYYVDVINRARETGRIGLYPHNPHLWVDTFWDLGKNDDTVIWFRQQIGNALIWIDYYENRGKEISDYVEVLKSKGYKYRGIYLPHDAGNDTITSSAAKLFRTTLDSAGIDVDVHVAPKPHHKIEAIRAVRNRFSRYFFNAETTRDGLGKLSLYHRKYDETRKVFLDAPVHDENSHAADALTTEALTENINEHGGIYGMEEPKIITDFNPLDYN